MELSALRPRPASAAGYSLIEALIATAVLGFIAIGILPLFTQAMVNNKQGADSTTVTTFSRTNLEALDTIAFDATAVTVPTGATSLVVVDWYVQQSSGTIGGTNGKWVVGATAPATMGLVLWKRTTTVQQFDVTDLGFTNPLPGGSTSAYLKRIQVVVQRPSAGMPVNAGKTITLQMLRAD